MKKFYCTGSSEQHHLLRQRVSRGLVADHRRRGRGHRRHVLPHQLLRRLHGPSRLVQRHLPGSLQRQTLTLSWTVSSGRKTLFSTEKRPNFSTRQNAIFDLKLVSDLYAIFAPI